MLSLTAFSQNAPVMKQLRLSAMGSNRWHNVREIQWPRGPPDPCLTSWPRPGVIPLLSAPLAVWLRPACSSGCQVEWGGPRRPFNSGSQEIDVRPKLPFILISEQAESHPCLPPILGFLDSSFTSVTKPTNIKVIVFILIFTKYLFDFAFLKIGID